MTGFIPDDAVRDHAFHWFRGEDGDSCQYLYYDDSTEQDTVCGRQRMEHVNPGDALAESLIMTSPHTYQNNNPVDRSRCVYTVYPAEHGDPTGRPRTCGYPASEHEHLRRRLPVRVADVQQYAREPMPDEARGGMVVTLIDCPVDPLGTLAAVCALYTGTVYRTKNDVTDEQRRAAWADMRKTVLSGALETMQFTFLIEGCDRALTHQMVRSRFSFFVQESLRFATAEDWAGEVALPPSLIGRKDDDPLVSLWRKGMNASEDAYAALVAAGMPTEEARGLLPHAIPTRIFWTMSMRTLLLEAGKRTCTQAQFPWRVLFAGIAKALRGRAEEGEFVNSRIGGVPVFEPFLDNWQYLLFAEAIEPVCYQTGRCGFKADFDRACSIRERVDKNEAVDRPSSEWGLPYYDPDPSGGPALHKIMPIDRSEWLADPSAARITKEN